MEKTAKLKKLIEKKRKILENTILSKKNLQNSEIIKISQELDNLISIYNKMQSDKFLQNKKVSIG